MAIFGIFFISICFGTTPHCLDAGSGAYMKVSIGIRASILGARDSDPMDVIIFNGGYTVGPLRIINGILSL